MKFLTTILTLNLAYCGLIPGVSRDALLPDTLSLAGPSGKPTEKYLVERRINPSSTRAYGIYAPKPGGTCFTPNATHPQGTSDRDCVLRIVDLTRKQVLETLQADACPPSCQPAFWGSAVLGWVDDVTIYYMDLTWLGSSRGICPFGGYDVVKRKAGIIFNVQPLSSPYSHGFEVQHRATRYYVRYEESENVLNTYEVVGEGSYLMKAAEPDTSKLRLIAGIPARRPPSILHTPFGLFFDVDGDTLALDTASGTVQKTTAPISNSKGIKWALEIPVIPPDLGSATSHNSM